MSNGLNPSNVLNTPITGFEDIIWNGLGDSITVNTSFTTKFYHEYVMEILGIKTFRNYGVGGTSYGIRSGRTDSFVERYPNMDNNAQLITVFGGHNDIQIPIGSFGDRIGTTFYGACHLLYNGLTEKYPGAKIGIILPLPRNDGYDLTQIAEIEAEVAAYYSIPHLDLFSGSGINFRSTAITDLYAPDKLHLNALGHQIIAPKIAAFIRSL